MNCQQQAYEKDPIKMDQQQARVIWAEPQEPLAKHWAEYLIELLVEPLTDDGIEPLTYKCSWMNPTLNPQMNLNLNAV